jgi:putative addiction module killer protein
MSPIDDSNSVKVELSTRFVAWRDGLRDRLAVAKIASRILGLKRGHWGDVKPVGGGVSELRIHTGPGYRIYLTRRGADWIVLLCGGDKDSQARDIATAKSMASEFRDAD